MQRNVIPLDRVRMRLARVWLGLGGLIVLFFVAGTLGGKYGSDAPAVWGWLLPSILPSLGTILSVLGYSAINPSRSSEYVRKGFYQMAMWLSTFYLLLIPLPIFISAYTGGPWLDMLKTSSLWLGPLQGLVAAALGVLFSSKEKAKFETARSGEPAR